MNEIIFLKVGGAGVINPRRVNIFNPADVADIAIGVYYSSPVEEELL